MKKHKLIRPSPAEDASINAGIHADPDTHELSDSEFAQLRRPRGRPKAAVTKVPVTMRIDPDVLEAIKVTGGGWQGRVNTILRKVFLSEPTRKVAARKSAKKAVKGVARKKTKSVVKRPPEPKARSAQADR